ncbi:MAG TPA: methionine biosynthesis protein MetW [Acidobacteriota bacterium]|jgi:O-antigen chain-terminating methyltransferase
MKLFDHQDRQVNVPDLMQRLSASVRGVDTGSSSDDPYRVALPEWLYHPPAGIKLDVPPLPTVSKRTRFRALKLVVDRLIRFYTADQNRFNVEVKQAIQQMQERQAMLLEAQKAQINPALASLHVRLENTIWSLAESIENARVEFLNKLGFKTEVEAAIQNLARSIENVRIEFTAQLSHFQPARTLERLAVLERDVRRLADLAKPVTETPGTVDRKAKEIPVKSIPAPSVKNLVDDGGFDYFQFELRFRGSELEIKQRQKQYARYFEGKTKVLDLACGRGEFLEILREMGQAGTGVDWSRDNVLLARSKGLNVVHGEALEHLRSVENESLDGVFTAQFVEHLTTDQFLDLNRLVFAKLKSGGVFIAETINPATLAVHANALYMDLTHQRPIHPATFQFLLESLHYQKVDLLFSSPIEDHQRLRRLPGSDPAVVEFNHSVDFLNELLYGARDYAVIAVK